MSPASPHKLDFQRYVATHVRAADGRASLAPQLAIVAGGAKTTAAIAAHRMRPRRCGRRLPC